MFVKGFVEGSSLFDITPVENMFISEYMLRAPGDYVKVYLLALNLSYYPHDEYTTADMARELGLEEDDVKNALVYWAQCSLIEIVGRRPFAIKFKNIKQMLQNDAPKKDDMYKNQDLIMQIQQSFGGRRLLNTSDTKKVLNWATRFKWSPEMIALVVSWCVERKGRWVHFSYIDTVINSMHDAGINAYDEAEKYLTRTNAKSSGATELLNDWNENRVATSDEIDMYDKWINKWKFDKGAINVAKKQMVGVSGNKFKYLDSILNNWYNNGVATSKDAKEYIENSSKAKELTIIIYDKSTINKKTLSLYNKMCKLGFSHEILIKAAKILKSEGCDDFDEMLKVLSKWHNDGINSDIRLYERLEQIKQVSIAMNEVVKGWGEIRKATVNEKRAYSRWTSLNYEHSKILEAAKLSVNAENKIPYMNAILTSGADKKVVNKNKGFSKINKGVMSHEYTDEDFEKIWDAMEGI